MNTKETKVIDKNSEILTIDECIMCNPNGDPDNENKPRLDYKTMRALISDVRKKRYIRDFMEALGKIVFVSRKSSGSALTSANRILEILKNLNREDIDLRKLTPEDEEFLLTHIDDIRLFGALIAIPKGTAKKSKKGKKDADKEDASDNSDNNKEESTGASIKYTGPVQFSWGYTLNKIFPINASITSAFSSKEESHQTTIGKDYRIAYGAVAFYGVVSKYRAEKTLMSEDDLKFLDKALVNAISFGATTRSKVGQRNLLTLRIQYKKDVNLFIGDLRTYINLIPKEGLTEDGIRSVKDYDIDFSELIKKVKEHKSDIDKIFMYNQDIGDALEDKLVKNDIAVEKINPII